MAYGKGNVIQNIITKYNKSQVYSEAEVRSKLIVPLIEALGYPAYLRGEEFPVYGFEGRNKIPAKGVDFILFADKDFNSHRSFSNEDIQWVHRNSLMVIEAKRPEEMPEILGQPMYYTIWTRAVAYVAIDGINIKGYFYNNISADYEVINCLVEELPIYDNIWWLSFENICAIKKKGRHFIINTAECESDNVLKNYAIENNLRLIDADSVEEVTEADLGDIPEDTFSYMRRALGRNASGLNKLQLLARFLNTTDALLQNDLRYDVPKYIIEYPRRISQAFLYIDRIVLPIDSGSVTEFYWEDFEKFLYKSQYIQISLTYKDGKLQDFDIGFQVLDNRVAERLESFDMVKKVLKANTLTVVLDNDSHRFLSLPSGHPGSMWENKACRFVMCDFWCNGLEQMRVIEEFYKINFKLKYIEGEDNLNALYDAISFVYDGIALNENCEILLPGGTFGDDIVIEEPFLLDNNKEIPLPERVIHGIHFAPFQSWILPGTINLKDTTENDIVRVSGCCRYKIVNSI